METIIRNVSRYGTILACTLLSLPALAQAPGKTIDVGGWTITHERKADGTFSACTAEFSWDDKSSINFVRTRKANAILVLEPTAKLVKDKMYPVSIQIDRNPPILATGVAVDATETVIPLDDPATMFTQISAGNTIYIEIDKIDDNDPLKGSAAAIKALDACFAYASAP